MFIANLPYGVIVHDGRKVVEAVKQGHGDFLEGKVAGELKKKYNAEESCEAFLSLREPWRHFFPDFQEYRKAMNREMILLARKRMGEKITKERFMIQAVMAIEDFNDIINREVERLREWYSYHYPELKEQKHSRFVKMVMEFGRRESFPDFSQSFGVEMDERDEAMVKEFASVIHSTMKLQQRMEKYVERLMEEMAPNTSEILGPLLGAKIISMFGSLEKMARASSSAIQLIGAEKALFRHLKSGKRSKPPKYGILYRHPLVQSAKPGERGKVARIIASYASKAAKIDFFSGRRESLREEMMEQLRKVLK